VKRAHIIALCVLLGLSVLTNVVTGMCFWFEHMQFESAIALCGPKK